MYKKIFFILIVSSLIFSCASTDKKGVVKTSLKSKKDTSITSTTTSKKDYELKANTPSQGIKGKTFTSRKKKPSLDFLKNIDFGNKVKTEAIVITGFAGIIVSLALKILKT